MGRHIGVPKYRMTLASDVDDPKSLKSLSLTYDSPSAMTLHPSLSTEQEPATAFSTIAVKTATFHRTLQDFIDLVKVRELEIIDEVKSVSFTSLHKQNAEIERLKDELKENRKELAAKNQKISELNVAMSDLRKYLPVPPSAHTTSVPIPTPAVRPVGNSQGSSRAYLSQQKPSTSQYVMMLKVDENGTEISLADSKVRATWKVPAHWPRVLSNVVRNRGGVDELTNDARKSKNFESYVTALNISGQEVDIHLDQNRTKQFKPDSDQTSRLSSPLKDDIRTCIQDVLGLANVKNSDIYSVVMLGKSAKIDMIPNLLREVFENGEMDKNFDEKEKQAIAVVGATPSEPCVYRIPGV